MSKHMSHVRYIYIRTFTHTYIHSLCTGERMQKRDKDILRLYEGIYLLHGKT